jgi:hypothetical protein
MPELVKSGANLVPDTFSFAYSESLHSFGCVSPPSLVGD